MEELSKIIMEAHMSNSFQDEIGDKMELRNKPKRIRKLRPGVCQYCDKWFADGRHLYAHVRIHTGEKPFVCNVCHKGFNQSSNLRRHLVVHSERKPLNCEDCGRQFMDRLHFQDHVRAHSGVKPYSCQICNKKYAYRNSLICHKVCHKVTHAKKKRVRKKKEPKKMLFCQVCKEGFKYESLLKYHMRIHNTEVKSYQCTLCRRVFSRSTRFHSHLLSIHNIKIAFQCKICSKRFPDKKAFGDHYLNHTTDMESTDPKQKETYRTGLNKEIENDPLKRLSLSEIYKNIKIAFQCRKCNERFPDKKSLEIHYQYHEKDKESVMKEQFHKIPLKKETNRAESYKNIEYDTVKRKYLSEISCASQKEVEIKSEEDFENDNTENSDYYEVSSCSQKKLQIETLPEHNFENEISQNKNFCEMSLSVLEELEIKTESEHNTNNKITKNRYLCGICFKEFSCVTDIQEHLRTHAPQYIFVCHRCKKCFNSKPLLKQHVCSANNEIKLLECYICEEKFPNVEDLKEHLSNHTEEANYF